jgi:hypothetical protein
VAASELLKRVLGCRLSRSRPSALPVLFEPVFIVVGLPVGDDEHVADEAGDGTVGVAADPGGVGAVAVVAGIGKEVVLASGTVCLASKANTAGRQSLMLQVIANLVCWLLGSAARPDVPKDHEGRLLMTFIWFIVWLIANLVGAREPLLSDWTSTLILAVALDLSAAHASRAYKKRG